MESKESRAEWLVLDYLNDLYKNIRVLQILANTIEVNGVRDIDDTLVKLKMLKKYSLVIDAMTTAITHSIESVKENE